MRSSANSARSAGDVDVAPASDPDRSLTMIPWLVDATTEVFQTMVFTSLTPGAAIVDGSQPVANVVGAVRFLGTVSGCVSFYSSDTAAREIAGAMLGISPEEASDEVCDTVGEITNMIAGTLRGKLAQKGDTLMITPPSVTRGTDFHAQHFNVASRVLCPFKMGGHDVFVELILQSV
jgi:chemotaxis protein CheX